MKSFKNLCLLDIKQDFRYSYMVLGWLHFLYTRTPTTIQRKKIPSFLFIFIFFLFYNI